MKPTRLLPIDTFKYDLHAANIAKIIAHSRDIADADPKVSYYMALVGVTYAACIDRDNGEPERPQRVEPERTQCVEPLWSDSQRQMTPAERMAAGLNPVSIDMVLSGPYQKPECVQ